MDMVLAGNDEFIPGDCHGSMDSYGSENYRFDYVVSSSAQQIRHRIFFDFTVSFNY
jgi:hypothetical protein